ncbi:PVC-type heme-binding CxxCH protein [Portibacter marinus]|uniref:PVC-type heme-binding CxxCH protein n=1 Tax=Portibacter marinus TaxID=2898660 RepID=UPI001F434577|nr:PVC-type heme-binding CxxCH protein [Portibacter marinus]
MSNKEIENIVFVGGSFIANMEDHPVLEVEMTKYYYPKEVSFKNIGWAADDVFGKARSQFGSAQNTRSWLPPSAEEGYGSEALFNHIKEANPTTLFIGYGGEGVFFDDETDFGLFESGYLRLLDRVDSLDARIILLTPPPVNLDLTQANKALSVVSDFIIQQAETRQYVYIDLNQSLKEIRQFAKNGLHLNAEGHQKVAEVILKHLQIQPDQAFELTLDENGIVEHCLQCDIMSQKNTVNGTYFKFKPDHGIYKGRIHTPKPASVHVNGRLISKAGRENHVVLALDSMKHERLVTTIREKNRLWRSRMRPLNEAYIYLFRRHEMGHLAYEMDDLLRLVEEKEEEIRRLMNGYEYDLEVEMEKPYEAPKKYADDEIPAFIPEPDVVAEQKAFRVPEGFEVQLFAKDPMIANPININWDTRGRAWVATSSTYPHIVPGREPNDKIVILEDTDGDGVADKHIVFAENLLVPHSVMPVKGGAYVTATTQLLFLADYNGDDQADETFVVYDGFGNADVHHTIHGLKWMPWGDLHFTQGIYINSYIETKDGIKSLNGAGIWSYNPLHQKLEVFSRGLINPWGEALNEWGQSFSTDGASYAGISYIFPGSAHMQAVGSRRILPGLNTGKPKYTGAAMVYSSNFPGEWKGHLITNDFRANRTIRYALSPQNSAYEAEELQTLLVSENRSYRPVDTKFGPDGALYIVDWYNPIIDHGEVDFHHPLRDKTHGRIWKLVNKKNALAPQKNIRELSLENQFSLLKSEIQVVRILANRALVERQIEPSEIKSWMVSLKPSESKSRIEGLWLLAAIGHFDKGHLERSLQSDDHRERAAAIRLISHYDQESQYVNEFRRLIRDPHAQVRLETLHALRNAGTYEAVEVGIKVRVHEMDEYLEFALSLLLQKTEDLWLEKFADGEDLFDGDTDAQVFALLTSEEPQVAQYLYDHKDDKDLKEETREEIWEHLALIGVGPIFQEVIEKSRQEHSAKLLSIVNDSPLERKLSTEILDELHLLIKDDSLKVQKEAVKLVGKWQANGFENDLASVIDNADDDELLLQCSRALIEIGTQEKVRKMASTPGPIQNRLAANIAWIEHDPEAAVNNAVDLLKELEKADHIESLIRAFVRTNQGPEILVNALRKEALPEMVASASLRTVQTAGLNLLELEQVVKEAGGISSIGLEMSEEEKSELIVAAQNEGDQYRGRLVYRRQELMCGSCHMVDKLGGLSGPHLGKIGSFMTPAAILEAVINPNADIKQNYETMIITNKDDEKVIGILDRKTDQSMRIRQANGQVIEIRNSEIKKTEIGSNSLMPVGLTAHLHKDELRDLLAYLMSLGVDSTE